MNARRLSIRRLGDNGRVRATAIAGIAVALVMTLLGMEPRLVLLGLIVTVAASILFLSLELSERIAVIRWQDFDSSRPSGGVGDRRVAALRSTIARSTRPRTKRIRPSSTSDPNDEVNEVATNLVELIDDYLLNEASIDRATEPERASAAVGPTLSAFLSDPKTRETMTKQRNLASTLDLVADLTTPRPQPRQG